jgi:ABC-type lipoprotein release transport system permease subunit
MAFVCGRLVKAQLYEFAGTDAQVMVAAIVVIAVAACMAAIIPARRAASIEPMQALRTE